MRSFAQIVYEYARIDAGGSASSHRRAEIARFAGADLQHLLLRKNRWNHYHRSASEHLWGSESITIASLANSNIITLADSAQVETKWNGQDIVFGNSNRHYLISRINDSYSFQISPDYSGTISSGDTATIRQRRIGLPENFGRLGHKIFVDGYQVSPKSVEELNHAWSHGAVTSGHYMCAVEKNWLQIYPSRSGMLQYDYSFLPENPFWYASGKALIKKTNLRAASPMEGAQWSIIDEVDRGMIFEDPDNYRKTGYSYPYNVLGKESTGIILLDKEFQGTTDRAIDYVLSTDVDLPPYLVRPMLMMAKKFAGKASDQEVYAAIAAAKDDDDRHSRYENESSGDTWLSPVYHSGQARVIIGSG